MKLVLVRHGESEWNRENLFTGWTDIGLTEKGEEEAKEAGRLLRENGYDFDVCYTSYLKRAIHTLNNILEELDRDWLPVVKSWRLNERHYGALQGLNKAETIEKYGTNQVKIWRRSLETRPPQLEENDERNPRFQLMYKNAEINELILGESLRDTINRVIPYFERNIKKDMGEGKKVIIVAHGNSIRALVQSFEGLSENKITEVNIPTGIPLVYEFDNEFNYIGKEYLKK